MSEDCIEVIADEEPAVDRALDLAEEGDLLLILGDDITRCWKQIIYFESEKGESSPEEISPVPAEEVGEMDALLEAGRLIRDDRGVRLAKEESD